MATQREREAFKIKLKWNVYNQEFKELHNFSYSNFVFKFNITEQSVMEEFCDLVCDTDNLMPWDVCNFFIKRGIKFSIGFRYVKEIGLKGNLVLFKCVLFLKKEQMKIIIKNFMNSFAIVPDFKKRMNNGKERRELMLQLINCRNRTIYFVQVDSNIWWKPRRVIEEGNDLSVTSFGWLFMQVGKAVFK